MTKTVNPRHLINYCRTCLEKLEAVKYEIEQLPKTLLQTFKRIVGSKKHQKALHPKWICEVCCNKIKSFDEFRVLCQKSAQFLEQLVELKTQDEVETEEPFMQTMAEEHQQSGYNLKEDTQACEITRDENLFEKIFVDCEVKQECDDLEAYASYLPDALELDNDQTTNVKNESSSDKMDVGGRGNNDTTCKICNLTYSTIELLKTHMRVHKELRPFLCKKCDNAFSKKTQLNFHMKEVHTETPIKIDCKFGCGKIFCRKQSAEAHYRNKHNSEKVYLDKKTCFKNENFENKSDPDNSIQDFKKATHKKEFGESSDDNFDLLFVSKTTCKICYKTFSALSALSLHMRFHKEKLLFQCDKCDRGFQRKARLKEHILEMHSEKALEIICKFGCGKSFLRFQTAATHYRKKHSSEVDNEKKLGSDLLLEDEKSSKQKSNDEHLETDKQNLNDAVIDKLTCKICLQTYSSASTLRVHMRLHRGKRPFQCGQCERDFNKRARLKRHIEESHTIQPVKIFCKFGCGKIFRRQETASNHYYLKHKLPERGIKANNNSFVCEDCGRLLKSMASLREHSFTHRPAEDRPFKCNQCNKAFISKRSYDDHILRHAGIKKYECPHCGIKKTTQRELRIHVNYHTSKKTYSCSTCAKVFNRVENLRLHERVVHLGIRRYKCPHCEQAFGKPDTLKHHVMRHTGERPHKCQICDRSFIQAVALRTHMKTHAN